MGGKGETPITAADLIHDFSQDVGRHFLLDKPRGFDFYQIEEITTKT